MISCSMLLVSTLNAKLVDRCWSVEHRMLYTCILVLDVMACHVLSCHVMAVADLHISGFESRSKWILKLRFKNGVFKFLVDKQTEKWLIGNQTIKGANKKTNKKQTNN